MREIDVPLFGPTNELITSEITELECRRTLDRIRIEENLSGEEMADRISELNLMLHSFRIVQLTHPILKRAKASYPTVVRSLDAIHLATAELARVSIFQSRDKQQVTAATAIGLDTQ